MIFAAIDIGSNAIRLIFYDIAEENKEQFYNQIASYRVPIRLGEDAFVRGKISDDNSLRLLDAMHAFRYLINVFKPKETIACATSAMRDAKNGKELAKKIRKECNIPLEIISGEVEAAYIFENHIEEELNLNGHCLYIDVGGGSTELTLIHNGKRLKSESFNLGTVRILNSMDKKSEWKRLSKWIESTNDEKQALNAIASGGNINRLYKLSKGSQNYSLSYDELYTISERIRQLTYEERRNQLKLKADRADVIVPASDLYLYILKKASISSLYIPQFSLADGMIRHLYENFKKKGT